MITIPMTTYYVVNLFISAYSKPLPGNSTIKYTEK